ncbi:MAG: flagellar basal body-associated protein FliL [Hyphomicrobiales bacterium]|nr:MAG: flagellar basal body-associated protein FliL [Hyphomicrobiales bacterium]
MAEDEIDETGDGEASESEGEGKKSRLPSKKVMIIAAAALLVLAGGGAGMFLLDPFGLFGGDKAGAEQTAPKKQANKYGYYDLPEMVVNLTSEKGRKHFLKVNVTLQVQDRLTVAMLKPYEPALQDAFQGYLRELRMEDLEGSAGLYRLKTELLKRVNTTVYPQKAEAVLFKQIIVQ